MAKQVSKSHFVLIPNIESKEFAIGDFSFKQGGLPWLDECNDLEERDLLKATVKMVQNEGLSSVGSFLYCFSDLKGLSRNEIFLKVRKVMALLRFAAFEEGLGLSVEDLSSFVFQVVKSDDESPETRYWLNDVLTGDGFFAPGFPNESLIMNYPHAIFYLDDHYLIKKYNENYIEDKYISAIEWYNRTFEQSSDIVENMIKLAVAFEKMHPLKTSDKSKEFGRWLFERFDSKDAETWGKDFYETRGAILHGNEFYDYPREQEKNKPQKGKKCIYWRNPEGNTDYTSHASIGREIFKFLLREEILGEEVKDKIIAERIKHDFIENLLVPNEVRYQKLKELVDSGILFGEEHLNLISDLKYNDFTGDKETIFSLLEYYLEKLDELLPILKDKTGPIRDLMYENNRKLFPTISSLSKQIELHYTRVGKTLVLDEKTTKLHILSRLFQIVATCLSQIFWREVLGEGKE
ncbi:MAG: hypothetical protein WBD28_00410 [Candidatus Zixiibacteriota bacterium]